MWFRSYGTKITTILDKPPVIASGYKRVMQKRGGTTIIRMAFMTTIKVVDKTCRLHIVSLLSLVNNILWTLPHHSSGWRHQLISYILREPVVWDELWVYSEGMLEPTHTIIYDSWPCQGRSMEIQNILRKQVRGTTKTWSTMHTECFNFTLNCLDYTVQCLQKGCTTHSGVSACYWHSFIGWYT